MTAQDLKNSILQMAVQGKLVPQDPNDELASVLLERIKTEKEALINAGKIKKEKNSSAIFRGSDNLPYEKMGDKIHCIADEVPFEIPDTWEYARLSNICTKLVDGDHNPPRGELSTTEYIMGSSTNINNDTLVDLGRVRFLSKEVFQSISQRTMATKGDIFLTTVGSLGRSCIFDGKLNICFQRSVSILSTLIFNQYLKLFFDSPSFQKKIEKESAGTAQKGFYLNQLAQALIPVPPLLEQKRIVDKVMQFKHSLFEYDKCENDLSILSSSFPGQIKKSILQEAIQGRLIPQDPDDEPASVLLERIRAEKDTLIRDGKIKQDKNESMIFRRDNSYYEKQGNTESCIDDELLFEIPNNWNWARLKTVIINDVGGGTPDKSKLSYWDGNIPWMSVKDFSGAKNGLVIDTIDHISQEGVENSATNIINTEAIILCTRMGLGKFVRLSCPTAINQDLRAIWLSKNISDEYFLLFYSTVSLIGSGVTVKGIKREELVSLLIPIPPLNEQERIVEQFHKLISLFKFLL